MESRFVMRSFSEGRSPGNTWRKREVSLFPYAGWRYDFKIVQRSNQFDQFSELGQHDMSRRGICGIWRRDLTCDHLPKAVLQGIRRARGKCPYCLTQGIGGISTVCGDLINSIGFSELGQHEKSRLVIQSRLLTCDHLPKAVVQGIRGGRVKYRYFLTYGGGRISKVCRDLINSISFLS